MRLAEARRSASVAFERGSHARSVRNVVDLASRRSGAIEVALIWDRRDQSLVVFAHDAHTQEEVAIPVTGDEAAEVYRHPFAYAHRSIDLPR